MASVPQGTIRGMVPHKTARGSAALDRLKTFEGIPHPYDAWTFECNQPTNQRKQTKRTLQPKNRRGGGGIQPTQQPKQATKQASKQASKHKQTQPTKQTNTKRTQTNRQSKYIKKRSSKTQISKHRTNRGRIIKDRN